MKARGTTAGEPAEPQEEGTGGHWAHLGVSGVEMPSNLGRPSRPPLGLPPQSKARPVWSSAAAVPGFPGEVEEGVCVAG